MSDLTFIILGWLVGGFVNGLAGFGAAMIAMPVIAPYIDFSIAVPSCTLIILTLNCQISWTFRRYIQYRYLKGILWGAIPGVLLSMVILEYVSEPLLKVGLGTFIVCYALWSLSKGSGDVKKIHPGWGILSGALSSSLGMAFGFNGPPLAAYIAYCGCPARSVKGILGAGLVITGIFIVSAKALTGQMTSAVLLTYVTATPAVILGSKMGIWASSYLTEQSYRKLLLLTLAVMGLNIIWSVLGPS